MNLALLDPFAVASEYPETLTQTLSYGHSTSVRYNEKGDYLASGLIDGTIVIIDRDTNNIIKVLRDHTRSITSLNWSRCGRYILSSSRDWKVNLWDLETGEVIRTSYFEGPIWKCVLIPGTVFKYVAALLEDDPVFVDITDNDNPILTKLETDPLEDPKDGTTSEDENGNSKKAKKISKQYTLVASVQSDGKYIYTGTNKGWMNIIDTASLKIVKSIKICNSNIKSIELSPNSTKIVVNASDRIARQFKLPEDIVNEEFELEHKYQDAVNRLQWNSLKFNNSGEYLCASTLGATHDIYIWETSLGSLIKILEGSIEELIEVDWNFRNVSIVSTGMDTGTVYIWSTIIPQKWSALAPDFEEIEENIDYEEKEDEFDQAAYEDDSKKIEEEEKVIVDVLTKEETDARGFAFIDSFVIDADLELE